MKNIVHFSQLVQRVLGGPINMQQDFHQIHPDREVPFLPPLLDTHPDTFLAFRIRGLPSGVISIIGPTYSEIIGNPSALKKWTSMLSKEKTLDVQALRRKNEGFLRVLQKEMNQTDLRQIAAIEPYFSWKMGGGFIFGPEHIDSALDSATSSKIEDVTEPRLFLTQHGAMGLIPPNAQKGDVIWQFCRSDVAAVVRKEGTSYPLQTSKIVGRAVVANNWYIKGSKFQFPEESRFTNESDIDDFFMDLRTLQLLTQ